MLLIVRTSALLACMHVLASCAAPAPACPPLPQPYQLSRCTLDAMKARQAKGQQPRCEAVDWEEVTAVMLKLEELKRQAGQHD